MLRRCLILLLLSTAAAHAVVVRGHVRTPLGAPVAGARVQLIAGQRSVGDAVTSVDGEYEIRVGDSGRFLLLTSLSIAAGVPSLQIGSPFYGGRLDLIAMDVALDQSTITPQVSALTALHDRPLAQLAEHTEQVRPDELLTQATIVPVLRPLAGSFLVEAGPRGAPARLYLRGSSPDAVKVQVDGVSAEDLGGGFNFGTTGSSGLGSLSLRPAVELAAGGNPLYSVDAAAGVVSLHSAAAEALHPTLIYTGDAGNLATLRNEGVLTLTHTRADLLASFARFDTSNDTPATPFHLATTTANTGYQISGGTSLRATLRDEVAAGPPVSPLGFFGIAPAGREATQNLFASATFVTATSGGWRNQLRYGLARKRAQSFAYGTPATGLPVTIVGANGYSASGTATFLPRPAREDRVTNRDEVTYETDYGFTQYLHALGSVRYQDERGADLQPGARQTIERTHVSVTAGFDGEVYHRLFYEASGLLDHSPTLGFRGAPRIGLTWAAVRPGSRFLRGTTLHATAATGFREPGLDEQTAGATNTPRSRTFDVAIDQRVFAQKLTLRGAYFHGQYSHQFELLAAEPLRLSAALAYRAQGGEVEARYQPFPRVLLHGGYTYTASLVEQTGALATANPNLPGIAIAGTTALLGARPFQRPAHTGFLAAEYTGTAFAATMKATLASRSDDSTYLTRNPNLLLPNLNLSPGWVSIDAGATYTVSHRYTAFVQLTNLADSRSIAPIGYSSTPFAVRSGLRIRLGRE